MFLVGMSSHFLTPLLTVLLPLILMVSKYHGHENIKTELSFVLDKGLHSEVILITTDTNDLTCIFIDSLNLPHVFRNLFVPNLFFEEPDLFRSSIRLDSSGNKAPPFHYYFFS